MSFARWRCITARCPSPLASGDPTSPVSRPSEGESRDRVGASERHLRRCRDPQLGTGPVIISLHRRDPGWPRHGCELREAEWRARRPGYRVGGGGHGAWKTGGGATSENKWGRGAGELGEAGRLHPFELEKATRAAFAVGFLFVAGLGPVAGAVAPVGGATCRPMKLGDFGQRHEDGAHIVRDIGANT